MSIEFQNVSKRFGPKVILEDFSIKIDPGEIVFILGKSGAGKSVTLKHMVGMLQPDQGSVFVDQMKVNGAGTEELSKIRRTCGMVFQQPALLDSLSIYENIAFGLKQLKQSQANINKRVLEVLEKLHLSRSILDLFPTEISYGMQKRVSIARTLAPGPSYLLYDEPTTGLDPISTQAVNRLIQELSTELQVTSIVVSHDMGCALDIADRVIVLENGKIAEEASPSQLRQSKVPLVVDFLKEVLE